MGFRPLPPQRLPDIGRSRAGPHTRFGKRRVTVLPSPAIFAAIAEVGPPRWSGRLYRQGRLIGSIIREHRPDDSSVLVGKRDRSDIGMPSLHQLSEPEASRILFAA